MACTECGGLLRLTRSPRVRRCPRCDVLYPVCDTGGASPFGLLPLLVRVGLEPTGAPLLEPKGSL